MASYTLFYLKSPIFTRLSLIILALVTSFSLWLSLSKWPALALSLIFVGGIIIIFLYISSLRANLKVANISRHYQKFFLLRFLFFTGSIFLTPTFGLNIFYSWQNHLLLLFLILYLLLTLLMVSKFRQSFKGPLTEKFF